MTVQRPTFLRFVLVTSHPDTGVEEGIFRAAYELRDGSSTSEVDRRLLEALLSWFKVHLAIPARFNTSKSKGFYRKKTAGVSWLKPTALEQIAKMREIADILDRNGIKVSQVTTLRPGYIVFEDDHQVVAEPFRGERRRPAS
jgi:hypothetical protein